MTRENERSKMKTVDGIRKCRGLALVDGAAMVAGMAFGEDALCDDSLKEYVGPDPF